MLNYLLVLFLYPATFKNCEPISLDYWQVYLNKEKIQEFCDANKDHKYIEKLNEEIARTISITADIEAINHQIDVEKNEKVKKELRLRTKKQTPVEAIRIGTMGRISELGLVQWEIIGSQSKFSLGDEKLISSIVKK